MSNVAGDSTVIVMAMVVMVTMTVSISVSDGGLNQSKCRCVGSALRAHNCKTKNKVIFVVIVGTLYF